VGEISEEASLQILNWGYAVANLTETGARLNAPDVDVGRGELLPATAG